MARLPSIPYTLMSIHVFASPAFVPQIPYIYCQLSTLVVRYKNPQRPLKLYRSTAYPDDPAAGCRGSDRSVGVALYLYTFLLPRYTIPMIAFLRGTVASITVKSIVLDIHGVGYQVFVTPKVLGQVEVGQEQTFHTYHNVREDGEELYGFLAMDERDMFEQLLRVNGVGPKSALGVLSRATVQDILQAITNEETSLLTKVSGIGAKTAERIVRELAGKVAAPTVAGKTSVQSDDADTLAALEQLGYSAAEARKALSQVEASITKPAERIRAVLRNRGSRV